MLDRETDGKLMSDIRDTLSHVIQATAINKLAFWLSICKSVLAASSGRLLLTAFRKLWLVILLRSESQLVFLNFWYVVKYFSRYKGWFY